MTGIYFNAVKAASSAASFSALLAVIVVAIVVQNRKYINTKNTTVAVTNLAMLLIATYMFVLISGMADAATGMDAKTQVLAQLKEVLSTVPDPSIVTRSSELFLVAGSLLAASAPAIILLIEFASKDDNHDMLEATHLILVIGCLVTAAFLFFGYLDVLRTLYETVDRSSVPLYVLALLGLPLGVPIIMAALFGKRPFSIYFRNKYFDTRPQDNPTKPSGTVNRIRAIALMVFFALFPSVVFRIIDSYGVPTSTFWCIPIITWLAFSFSLWSGLVLAYYLRLSKTLYSYANS